VQQAAAKSSGGTLVPPVAAAAVAAASREFSAKQVPKTQKAPVSTTSTKAVAPCPQPLTKTTRPPQAAKHLGQQQSQSQLLQELRHDQLNKQQQQQQQQKQQQPSQLKQAAQEQEAESVEAMQQKNKLMAAAFLSSIQVHLCAYLCCVCVFV
jgi:hypothetical protein